MHEITRNNIMQTNINCKRTFHDGGSDVTMLTTVSHTKPTQFINAIMISILIKFQIICGKYRFVII